MILSPFQEDLEELVGKIQQKKVGSSHEDVFDHITAIIFRHFQKYTWDSTRDYAIRYLECRLAGSSPILADMFATGKPPQSRTDVEFLRGHCNGNQFDHGPLQERIGNHYKRIAEDQGVNVKGKVYLSGLAKYVGDPQAWVSGRSDVERVCKERNWKCNGSVNVSPDGRESE